MLVNVLPILDPVTLTLCPRQPICSSNPFHHAQTNDTPPGALIYCIFLFSVFLVNFLFTVLANRSRLSRVPVIFTRDSIYAMLRVYATPIPSVRPSVCLSHAWFVAKTAERIIEILSQSDRPIVLVFRHQGSLRKSDGFTPNGAPIIKG